MESKNRLFSYTEALVALYLFVHNSYTLPSLGAWLPAIEDLPFIDYLSYNGEDLNSLDKASDKQLSSSYIRAQLRKCEDRRGQGFFIVNNRSEFTKFIKKYIAWYESGKGIYNPSNAHLYKLSYNHTVELLNQLAARFGNSFTLSGNELSEIESKHDRWVEILLSLHLKGYISIQPRFVSIITHEHIFIDPPEFSIGITILKPLEVGAKMLDSHCGIQITENKEVFYKGYPIAMDPDTLYFKLLLCLVFYKGNPQTVNDISDDLKKADSENSHANKHSADMALIQQHRVYLLKKFEQAAETYSFSVDFVIHCSVKDISIQPKPLRNKK